MSGNKGEYDKRDQAIEDLKRLLSWLSDEIAQRNGSRNQMSVSEELAEGDSDVDDVDLDEKDEAGFDDAILFESDEYTV